MTQWVLIKNNFLLFMYQNVLFLFLFTVHVDFYSRGKLRTREIPLIRWFTEVFTLRHFLYQSNMSNAVILKYIKLFNEFPFQLRIISSCLLNCGSMICNADPFWGLLSFVDWLRIDSKLSNDDLKVFKAVLTQPYGFARG